MITDALSANLAAILAYRRVKNTHITRISISGAPPIAKCESAPVNAVNDIMNTLVPTASLVVITGLTINLIPKNVIQLLYILFRQNATACAVILIDFFKIIIRCKFPGRFINRPDCFRLFLQILRNFLYGLISTYLFANQFN